MYVESLEPFSKEERLKRIRNRLIEVHGVDLDIEDKDIETLRETYANIMKVKADITSKSGFNEYHRDPDYSKAMLILEAVKIFLSEYKPSSKRKVRKRRG